MKRLLPLLSILFGLKGLSQVNHINFSTGNSFFTCDPPVYSTTGQSQCIFNNPFLTPAGNSVIYTTTASGSFGQDCRNWLRLSNPGFSFIGDGSEIQIRNAGNGSTIYNPARFLVKNFTPSTRFGITFDVALAGYGGAFYFRCGSGQAYEDTVYMISRDSSSFMVLKIDGTDPAINPNPSLRYSNAISNSSWPNVPNYFWMSGVNSSFPVYQKHAVAIFCNNTNAPFNYSYIGTKTLNPQSYDVYLDSVLDVDNMFDDFFGLNRPINSFMFAGSDATCANSGPYLGDTLIVDNIRWSSDLLINPLPVHLSSFTVTLGLDKKVLLNWRDETPEDGVRFDVQVSTDGRSFQNVGQITEQGSRKDYSFVYPNTNCGQLYFRLAFEGKYSEVRSVTIPCDVSLTSDSKSIRIQTKYPGTLTLINPSGQTLARTVLASGYSQVPLSVPSGIYIAKFSGRTGEAFTQKVLVQQ